jgi:hypothetical protein
LLTQARESRKLVTPLSSSFDRLHLPSDLKQYFLLDHHLVDQV